MNKPTRESLYSNVFSTTMHNLRSSNMGQNQQQKFWIFFMINHPAQLNSYMMLKWKNKQRCRCFYVGKGPARCIGQSSVYVDIEHVQTLLCCKLASRSITLPQFDAHASHVQLYRNGPIQDCFDFKVSFLMLEWLNG